MDVLSHTIETSIGQRVERRQIQHEQSAPSSPGWRARLYSALSPAMSSPSPGITRSSPRARVAYDVSDEWSDQWSDDGDDEADPGDGEAHIAAERPAHCRHFLSNRWVFTDADDEFPGLHRRFIAEDEPADFDTFEDDGDDDLGDRDDDLGDRDGDFHLDNGLPAARSCTSWSCTACTHSNTQSICEMCGLPRAEDVLRTRCHSNDDDDELFEEDEWDGDSDDGVEGRSRRNILRETTANHQNTPCWTLRDKTRMSESLKLRFGLSRRVRDVASPIHRRAAEPPRRRARLFGL